MHNHITAQLSQRDSCSRHLRSWSRTEQLVLNRATRRLSWDGFPSFRVNNGILHGAAWTPVGDQWIELSVGPSTEEAGGALALHIRSSIMRKRSFRKSRIEGVVAESRNWLPNACLVLTRG